MFDQGSNALHEDAARVARVRRCKGQKSSVKCQVSTVNCQLSKAKEQYLNPEMQVILELFPYWRAVPVWYHASQVSTAEPASYNSCKYWLCYGCYQYWRY